MPAVRAKRLAGFLHAGRDALDHADQHQKGDGREGQHLRQPEAIEGPGTISIDVERDGSRALLSVSDTGIGMTPEVLAHAMEPFFTTRADGTGNGLGLAMVYGFIRQSGGDVTLTSAPHSGTVVKLKLPLQGAAPAIAPLLALGHVLLVEDDPSDRTVARNLLAPHAAEVICCATAAEARHRLHAGNPVPDLIVTDLMLGTRIEGWTIAREALRSVPAMRALIVSGSLPATNPLEADHPARTEMVAKPLDQTALAAALAALLSERTG
ncbi:ATP-binding protein [Paracoccus sp. NSM]|uniref:ATP-binding protein n=1 Tax=Paracoccus sp. NSM TaxID=3457784 RepID=UPI0040350982